MGEGLLEFKSLTFRDELSCFVKIYVALSKKKKIGIMGRDQYDILSLREIK